MRKALSEGEAKIVTTVIERIERDLIEALPELNEGVNTAAASGSFSSTLQIKSGKRGRFKATVSSRVRTPREPYEIDMHVSDDGQLALGLPEGWEPTEE